MEEERRNINNTHESEKERDENGVDLPLFPLYLQSTPGKGRGVYAKDRIPSGSLIHISPVLLFPPSKTSNSAQNERTSEQEILSHYTYTWGESQALALGLGSMFNHSKRNNVGFLINKKKLIISYHTIREIEKDEELCINYGIHLWFDDADQLENEILKEDSDSGDENFLSKFCLVDESP